MFASAASLQREKPERPTSKRPLDDGDHGANVIATTAATQPVTSLAQWKRIKTEPEAATTATGFLTQPLAARSVANDQSSEAPPRTMLGAWFGARATQMSKPTEAIPTAVTRIKHEEATANDSEDDKPLSSVLVQRDWRQQRQLQRMQSREGPKGRAMASPKAKAKSMAATTTMKTTGFVSAANVAATMPQQQQQRSRDAAATTGVTRISSTDEERVYQLSSKRRVTVRKWKGTILVDLREYYDDNGITKPGKKGISLSKEQWYTLMRLARVIDQAVDLVDDDSVDGHSLEHVKERVPVNEDRTIAFTLSSKRRITVRHFKSSVLIDLREYYEQGSEMKPGKKGISLSKEQWRSLQRMEAEISESILEL